jgi:hypothetical protein
VSGVEFVVEEPDGDALAEPSPPRPSRAVVVRVVAGLLVVLAIAAWVGTRPSGRTKAPSAGPVVTVTAASRPTAGPAVICRAGAPVADEIGSAMHRFLPGIKVDNLSANRCIRRVGGEARVVSESVTGRVGALLVEVELSVRNVDFAPLLKPPVPGINPETVLGSVEVESAGLKGYATITGPAGHHTPMVRLRGMVDFLCLNTVL